MWIKTRRRNKMDKEKEETNTEPSPDERRREGKEGRKRKGERKKEASRSWQGSREVGKMRRKEFVLLLGVLKTSHLRTSALEITQYTPMSRSPHIFTTGLHGTLDILPSATHYAFFPSPHIHSTGKGSIDTTLYCIRCFNDAADVRSIQWARPVYIYMCGNNCCQSCSSWQIRRVTCQTKAPGQLIYHLI